MIWTPAQEFVYLRTYSRWLPDEMRREAYPETVARYMIFMKEELGDKITSANIQAGMKALLEMEVMPSMRALWSAGEAARQNNIALYNCAYSAITRLDAFAEALYILMCGTGFGFSVERVNVDKLPDIEMTYDPTPIEIVVDDSKEGWAVALLKVLSYLWRGENPVINYSKIRPRGARLITMGGRASGPEPLRDLFEFLRRMFAEKRAKKQKRLTTLEAQDILNKIAEIVVVGGVRRSSEIALSDLDDRAIAEAKLGDYPVHRAMSNNSAVYNGRPDSITFLEEWLTLVKSRAGERGIFNREGAIKHMASNGRRLPYFNVGTNPCGEIILRDMEFCNLSEVVVRSTDTLDSLKRKVRIATMFGAWQSTFTNFPLLRPEWKKNCEEERLLGVSLTGIMDHPVLNNVNDRMKRWLGELKGVALNEAEKWAKRLGINMSAAVTCVKPSGTVSQLVNCSSGIHPRFAEYYLRRYRISATDPLYHLMRDQGVTFYPEVGQDPSTASTYVVEFPIASPKGAKTRHMMTAIEQLEHWKVVKEFWCEHNPSITVYVADEEWPRAAAWVYDNFDHLCGVSFLPKDNHVYQLAPYEDITKEQYEEMAAKMPKIDYSKLSRYETDDNTQGAKSYACMGDRCELR